MKIKTILFAFLFLVVSNVAYGQSISIFDIDTTNFPIMKAKFYAFDKDGNQVRPSASELSIPKMSNYIILVILLRLKFIITVFRYSK